MVIDNAKLNIALARQCMDIAELKSCVSSQTLTRIRRCEDIKPSTLGKIAKALGVDPTEIMEQE